MHGFTGRLVMLLPMVSLATQGCKTVRSKMKSCRRPWGYSRCYQPVFLFKDFHHQDFSAIPVDLQEWKLRKLRMPMRTDVLQSLTLCRIWLEMGYKGCIQFIVQENGMYTIWLPPSIQFPVCRKASVFRKSKSIKCPMSMYVSALGGLNHWTIRA